MKPMGLLCHGAREIVNVAHGPKHFPKSRCFSIRISSLSHCRLFTDDWIMTGGKHWLFSFMKELSLFVESIKIPLIITPYSNQD